MSVKRILFVNSIILISSIVGSMILVIVLSTPLMGMFALGPIVSPGGIFDAAYGSTYSSQTISDPHLTNQVTVIRDIWGIPHIYGDSQEDVAFALGYLHAEDRLFQMEITLRLGLGRMAEIFGNDSLQDDIWFQTVGIEKTAEEAIASSRQDPLMKDFLKIMDIYCAGVNASIDTRIKTKTLPIEFHLLNFEPTPWTLEKIYAYKLLMGLQLTYSTEDLSDTVLLDDVFDGNISQMEELFPVNNSYFQVPVVPTYGNYSSKITNSITTSNNGARTNNAAKILRKTLIKQILDATPDFVRFYQQSWIGSNNWVAGSVKAAGDKPVLSNDMHLGINLPHIWYEAHLVVSAENINSYGYTLTGTPVIVVGTNTHVAWGFTNVANDAVDWYEYIWNGDRSMYWSGKENQWKSPSKRNVTIAVRGQPDHVETILYTEDGVVMGETEGKTMMAMRWVATEAPTYEMLALNGAVKAENWSDFNASFQYWSDPSQNVIFADSSGNIALRPSGKFIKRKYFGEGRYVINGSDPSINKTWEFIPYNELPYALNPPQGYLASANQKSTGPDYPYYISSRQSNGYRGRAINNLLKNAPSGSVDIEWMKDAQAGRGGIFDTRAQAFTPFFISAIESSGQIQAGSLLDDSLQILKQWQASSDQWLMNKTYVAPTIFSQTLTLFRNYVWNDEWAARGVTAPKPGDNVLEFLVKNEPDSIWFDDISTTGTLEDRDEIIVKAFKQAVTDLVGNFSSDVSSWVYGAYHRMYFDHLGGISAFSRGNYPHDGSGATLLNAGGREVRGGPSERMIVDFNDIANSLSVIPGGVSGNPVNPHYADQALELWIKGELHPMWIQYGSVTAFPKEIREVSITFNPV
ncbi:MAG: penicillin acylase family protein [Candidatus Heimdallarchaeota archaeon]